MRIREVLICSALASLCACLIAATAAVCVVAHVAQELPRQVQAELIETRSQVLGQVADAESHVLAHLDRLESKADQRLASIQLDISSQLSRTTDKADSQVTRTLERVDVALADLHGLREDARPVLLHAGNVAKQVDDAAPLFLDCDHNADCAFSRFQGTSKAVELAAQNIGAMSAEVRGALPAALLTWQRIGRNVDLTAGNVAKITRVRWYDNLLKGAGVGLGSAAIVLRH